MTTIPIANFEQYYTIDTDGQIISLARNEIKTLRENPNGYMIASLALGNGDQKQVLVHRLVALHFLPNPYQYPEVNHADGNKNNNNIDNLEWCSPQQNAQHALRTGLRPGYMSASEKEMYMYQVLLGDQVKDIATDIGRHPNTLHKMLRETAKRLNKYNQWQSKMKDNRKNAAIRNLEKNNYNRT